MTDETSDTPTPETAPPAPTPWRRRREEPPVRYLLDSRLFKVLCAAGGESALEGFRTSLERHGLAVDGGLPALELTPLAFLEVIGIEPPQLPVVPLPSSLLKGSEYAMAVTVLVRHTRGQLQERPELQADLLQKCAEELRLAVPAAAHALYDLCVGGFVSRDGFAGEVCLALAFDYVYRFPFPEVLREEVFDFFCTSLFESRMDIPGSSKIRVIKTIWDRAYERLLRGNVGARGEIQALDRELKLRTRMDHLAWESVHYATLGRPGEERSQAVTAFTLEPEDRAAARCIAYKTALRAFLDQFSFADLAELRSAFEDWKPGSLVPCRPDGTFDTVIPTGELPVYLGLRKAS